MNSSATRKTVNVTKGQAADANPVNGNTSTRALSFECNGHTDIELWKMLPKHSANCGKIGARLSNRNTVELEAGSLQTVAICRKESPERRVQTKKGFSGLSSQKTLASRRGKRCGRLGRFAFRRCLISLVVGNDVHRATRISSVVRMTTDDQ